MFTSKSNNNIKAPWNNNVKEVATTGSAQAKGANTHRRIPSANTYSKAVGAATPRHGHGPAKAG